jgi:hypothetical protein
MALPWAASENGLAQILVVGYLAFEGAILRLAILAVRGSRPSCYWWGFGDQAFIVGLALIFLLAMAGTSPFVGHLF